MAVVWRDRGGWYDDDIAGGRPGNAGGARREPLRIEDVLQALRNAATLKGALPFGSVDPRAVDWGAGGMSPVPLGAVAWIVLPDAPDGWLVADGSQVTDAYPALRSALVSAGSPYGSSSGNPLLPNLVGKFARGAGTGATLGATGGEDLVTLTIAQMPEHNHSLIARAGAAAGSNHVVTGATNQAAANFTTSPSPVGNSGGGQPHENRPPFVNLTPIIRAY